MGRLRDLPAQQLAGYPESAVEQVRVRVLPRWAYQPRRRRPLPRPYIVTDLGDVAGPGERAAVGESRGPRVFFLREDLDAFVRGDDA